MSEEEQRTPEEIWFSVNNPASTLFKGADYVIVKNNSICLFIDFDDEDGEAYPNLTLEQAKLLRWALGQAITHVEKTLPRCYACSRPEAKILSEDKHLCKRCKEVVDMVELV